MPQLATRAPGGPAAARPQARREAILDAAARRFNRRGLRGATLADVAADVGLATNSLTHYFRRKDDLAAACLLRAIDAVVAVCESAGAAPSAARRADAFVHGYVALLADIATGRHPELVRFHDIRALAPPQHAAVVAAYVPMFRRLRALLGEAPARTPAGRRLSAQALLLQTAAFGARAWIGRYDVDDFPLVASRIADVLLHGLSAGAPGWSMVPRWRGASPLADPSADATGEPYLRAATVLLNEQGYRGASVDRIASRLQRTKGAFYHRHADKDALIAACFARTFTTVRRAQAQAGALGGSGRERLLRAAGALACHQLSDDGPLLRLTARSALPEAMRRDTRRAMDRLAQRFGHVVVDGIADGSLRPVDPAVAADLVAGAVNAIPELRYWVPGFGLDEALDDFLRPLFTGLIAAQDGG